ncbi:DUF5675 family protein [Sphingobacterium faecium]|uniref:DUF5675 family protein n=1 Tax=Sphingobacterium faecium TaxID=34087 RepID=UPI0021B635D4|nr:DUF5675 family protein [Sphingobacterium faecium]UXD69387.1 DUF5675 family protein [Sphingobacterium faecium]
MGKMLVKRIRQGNNSTLSKIYVDDVLLCYGLEDAVREMKIKGETAIPAGRYRLTFNTYGAMNARYKRKFPEIHQGMVEIKGIPNYSYVYMHIGNNIGDTAGCLLVGESWELIEGDYELRKSKKAYVSLYKRLIGKMVIKVVSLEIRNEMLDSEKVSK